VGPINRAIQRLGAITSLSVLGGLIRPSSNAMFAIIYLLGTFIADLLKSRRRA
jgi:hypothetical protein